MFPGFVLGAVLKRWFAPGRHRQPAARKSPAPRPSLGVEQLEDRTVPKRVDLTTAGTLGGILGAQFIQGNNIPGGTGVINSFVRVQQQGNATTEQGYNKLPAQFDENNSAQFTRAIQLGSVGRVRIRGRAFYVFVLDINQENSGSRPLLSLDHLRLYVSPTEVPASSYDPATGRLNGLLPGYDMNPGAFGARGRNVVQLNGALKPGSGTSDMVLLVPVQLLGTNPSSFVYLYSQFGAHQNIKGTGGGAANDGFEEWATVTGLPRRRVRPALRTVPGPTVVVGSGVPMTDAARLIGANPTGTLTFTLRLNRQVVHRETVAGTYQWVVRYSGDANNRPALSPLFSEPEVALPPGSVIPPGGDSNQQGSAGGISKRRFLASNQ